MSFDQAWAAAEVDDSDRTANDPPEPGVYDAALDDFKAFTSKEGKDTVIIEWRVVAGPLADYSWPQFGGFNSEGRAKATKTMCSRLGIAVADVRSLDELQAAGQQFKGCYYQLEVVQKGEYRNVYVQQRLQPGAPATSDIPDNDMVPSQTELDEAREQAESWDNPGF